MKNPSSAFGDISPLDNSRLARRTVRSTPLQWWHALTAPAEPEASAPLAKREAARRGRLASTTLLFISIFTLLPLPVGIFSRNYPLLVVLGATLVINGIALAFNRRGRLVVAGLLAVTALNVGYALALTANPGGLAVSNLPTFDLLAESSLVAVAFFPPWSVFVTGLINSLFIWADLSWEHHTADLGNLIATSGYDVFVRPFILQTFVAVITYIWVRSALQAIARADRAEEIAALEQREIEQQQLQIEQKQQLDMGIQLILQTHVQVANGNFAARAPLNKDNLLWQIAYSLNNLLARLQSYGQMAGQFQHLQEENFRLLNALQTNSSAQQELQRTREAATRLVELLKQSRDGRISPSSLRSGTIIDAVATQLSDLPNSIAPSEQGQAIPQRTREQVIPRRTRTEMN